jgi:PelA/Pel-15E family pectate lyase
MKTKKSFLYIKITFAYILIINICSFGQLDLNRFYDSAHHWYDINDEDRVINPLPNRPKYNANEIIKIADNIILFQKVNGGWAKNFDMQAILSHEQIEKITKDKETLNTTFDNGATHSQLSYLAEVHTITRNEKYKSAFLKGLNFIFSSQYKNGGWPQFFPDTSGYRKHITFNDGAMIGVMKLLQKIINKDENYLFISDSINKKTTKVFEKGIECLLNTQIVENNQKYVWCQQHDNITLKPAKARTFEPAAICNGESAEIVLFLMELPNPSQRVKTSVKSSVKWFEESAINGIKVERFKAPKVDFQYHTSTWDKRVIEDSDAPRIWTRFYELNTHVPMFCRRDGKIVYSMAEVERERRTGYGWYTYAPEEILQKYPKWLKKWGKN